MRARQEFTDCFDAGRKYRTKNFIVFVRPRGGGSSPSRLGVAVSRKVGAAVRRNRVKRILREFFRRELFRQGQGVLPVGTDVVVVVRHHLDVDGLTYAAASSELGPLFRRIRGDVGRAGEAP